MRFSGSSASSFARAISSTVFARAGHAIDDAMTISQGTRITLLTQVEHREIGLAGANDHLRMDDAAEDVDLRRGQLRKGPPRIETSLEPRQQGLRLERIPGGQFVAGNGRAGWEQEGQLLRLAPSFVPCLETSKPSPKNVTSHP